MSRAARRAALEADARAHEDRATPALLALLPYRLAGYDPALVTRDPLDNRLAVTIVQTAADGTWSPDRDGSDDERLAAVDQRIAECQAAGGAIAAAISHIGMARTVRLVRVAAGLSPEPVDPALTGVFMRDWRD